MHRRTSLNLTYLFLFFICFTSAGLIRPVNAQGKEKEDKATFDIEEEIIEDLGAKEQITPEEERRRKAEEDNIIILGEDKLLIRSRKKPSELVEPVSEKNTKWSAQEGEGASKKDKAGPKKVETLSTIKTSYGLYNNLNVNLSVTKGGRESAHKVIYQRSHKGGEGLDFKIFDNSFLSLDQIITTNAFKISDLYRLFLRGYYLRKDQGLQDAADFTSQKQESWYLESDHLFALSEQRIKASLEVHHIDSKALRKTELSERGGFTSLKLGGSWEYFLGGENSLGATLNFFIAENKLYYSQKDKYTQGKLGVWALFPIYGVFLGEGNIAWNVHLHIGFHLFVLHNTKPIPMPSVALESRLGVWQLTLALSRESETPSITKRYLKQDFFKPIHFERPSDNWKASLSNKFHLESSFRFTLEGGFLQYNTYYYPALDTDGFYVYFSQKLRLFYGVLNWEHLPFQFFQYSLGLRAEHLLNEVDFRPPVYFVFNTYVSWGNLGFETNTRFSGEREASDQKLSIYILIDLSLHYRLTDSSEFYFEIRNTLNERYTLLPPYQTTGISFLGGFKSKI